MEKLKSRVASEDECFNSLPFLFFFFLNEETKISINAKHQSNLEDQDLLLSGHREDAQ